MAIFRQQDSTLIWEANNETLWLQPWGRDSLRVRASTGSAILERELGFAATGAEHRQHHDRFRQSDCAQRRHRR